MMIFKDRQAAGKLLAKRLTRYQNDPQAIVLSIPRGGVVVAYEVAKSLKLPLDIMITRKIGSPDQSELALGAVDQDGEVIWNERLLVESRIKKQELRGEIREQIREISRRRDLYGYQKRLPWGLEEKTVILVDDGIATGATVEAAIKYLKRHGVRKIIVAAPVAAPDTLGVLKNETDEVVVLFAPASFSAIGQFYQNFEQVGDEEVIELLNSGEKL